jgi:hypothetical protein
MTIACFLFGTAGASSSWANDMKYMHTMQPEPSESTFINADQLRAYNRNHKELSNCWKKVKGLM